VALYVDYFFNECPKEQFEEFKRGFFKVANQDIVSIMEPEELELIINGRVELDFDEWQRATTYIDGYTEEHPVCKWLWEILKEEFTETERKRFLMFVTGCDRAPLGGLGDLYLTVVRHGGDTEKLPCAHTCFQYLLMPEYSSKEKLARKLRCAIENAEGFGLI